MGSYRGATMATTIACTLLLLVSNCFADDQPVTLRADAVSDGTQLRITPGLVGGTTIEIRCESGIGNATLHRHAATWPRQMTLHLYLRGLESLKATGGDLTLEWSIASHGNHACTAAMQTPAGITTLDAESPYFAAVQIVGPQKQIPLAGGYFQVTLPARLLAANPKSIQLSWIDFYR